MTANYVAVGSGNVSAENSYIKWSEDGKSWKDSNASAHDIINGETFNGVAYSPISERWVASGTGNTILSGGFSPIKWSADGINWESATGSFYTIGSGIRNGFMTVNGIAYSPVQKRWVACGQGNTSSGPEYSPIQYSGDGKTWEPATGNFHYNSENIQIMNGVAYDPVNDLWVATGIGNTTLSVSPIKYSSDGKDWKDGTGTFYKDNYTNEETIHNIAYSPGQKRWVACSYGSDNISHIKWSDDGKTWTDATGTFYNRGSDGKDKGMNGVAYSPVDQRWVATGAGNTDATVTISPIQYSSDGKTWENAKGTFYETDKEQFMFGVTYSPVDQRWIACGSGNTTANKSPIYYSSDGITWEPANDGKFYSPGVGTPQIMTNVSAKPGLVYTGRLN